MSTQDSTIWTERWGRIGGRKLERKNRKRELGAAKGESSRVQGSVDVVRASYDH